MDQSLVFQASPYEMNKDKKTKYLNASLGFLTRHHYSSSENYRRIIDSQISEPDTFFDDVEQGRRSYKDIPFLPVRLFKEYDIRSVSETDVAKTITSSGTSGQARSRIYLDKETSRNQTKN